MGLISERVKSLFCLESI